jgi:anaerobic ribonucleoside-triphosphate reductase
MVFNVEQIPAESASHSMARFFGDDMYSNQFVPLDQNVDIWKRVEIEGRLSKIMTGGSMTFLHLGKMMDKDQSRVFHERVMQKSDMGLNQFCIDYGFSHCKKCNIREVGRIEKCACGAPMRHYQRVVGYMVPEASVNRPRVSNDISKRFGYEAW